MPDPLTGMIIAGGISSLLQGILSGAGRKKRQKTAMNLWQQMADKRMANINKYVRPEGEYTDYSQDPVMMKAVLGMLNQRTGMNIDLSQIGQRVPKPQSQHIPKQTGYAYKE
jgi:hypothetical protein